jgi:hypothetical protein
MQTSGLFHEENTTHLRHQRRLPAAPATRNRKRKPRPATEVNARALAAAGSSDDPRMAEALRMAKAFLAIEDETARNSLVALAERLATDSWASATKKV